MNEDGRIVDFLFEIGTMRKLMRMHRQVLLTDDMSDSIASHSYRVSIIGWHLAKKENADLYKTVMMCLIHDMAEVRSGDHNWVHKRYVKIFEDEIVKEQFGTLPYGDFETLILEYNERKTKEAVLAKDADLLDQILLLREYEWQGNKEASIWLRGKDGEQNSHFARLKSESAKNLGKTILDKDPSGWWNNLSTSVNR
jgi:putative hydrolase of HD superfamily